MKKPMWIAAISAAASLTAAIAISVDTAVAQTYPTRAITIVVPYPPGGPTDVVARLVGERLRVTLGQPVVIENVPGGAGNIGVGRAARAAPDGYTLSLGNAGSHILNAALYQLPYDVLKDFEPIALISSNAQLIVTKKSVPAKDLTELISWLQANQDKVSVGVAGPVAVVSAVYFQNSTGTKFQLVPYRGAAPALQDLIGGQIDLMFDQVSNALPQVRAGTVKAFALTAKTRLASAPDIPTVDEAGLPGFYVSLWHGLWVPKGTPKDVIAKLAAAVADALAEPQVAQQLGDIGQQVAAREQRTPEGFAAFQKAEADKWWPIIKAANLKGE